MASPNDTPLCLKKNLGPRGPWRLDNLRNDVCGHSWKLSQSPPKAPKKVHQCIAQELEIETFVKI